MYKVIYKNIIKQEDKIIKMMKGMIKADIAIKTNYIDEVKEYPEEIKKRFKKQWSRLEEIQNRRRETCQI